MLILKKVLLIILVFILILFSVIYFWIKNRWRSEFTVDQMKDFCELINETPKLPDNVYEIYDKLEPNHRHLTMNRELVEIFYGLTISQDNLNKKYSPCRDIYRFLEISNLLGSVDWNLRYNDYFFAWGINKFTSPEKCFDYVFSIRLNELKRQEERRNLQRECLTKKLENLYENEVLELYLIMKTPSRYDRLVNPEILDKKITELKEKIN